jgi:hypothetical protein
MNAQRQRERELAEQLVRIIDPSSAQAVAAALAFLLIFYVGLALAYRDAIPLFEAPDEPSHLHYAAFVYSNGRLPRQDPLEVPGEGMQAPLAYVVAAPLLGNTGLDVAWAARELARWAFPFYAHPKGSGGSPAISTYEHGYREFVTDGSLEPLRILRITSLAFGLLTVILTFAAVWRLSRDARMALLAGSLVAFNPQFLFSSGYFSNDPAAAAIGAAALWIVARTLEEPDGTLPGLAAAAVTLIAIDRRSRSAVAIDCAFAAACVLLLAGPYAGWAAEHRGGFLGVNAVAASAVGILHADHFGGQLPFLTRVYWDWTFESFWGRFGWFNVQVPKATYLAFFALTWTGALGLFVGRARLPEALRSRALHRYLLAAFGATFAGHFALNLAIVNPQGRLLFPSISQIALLLAIGLVRLVGNDRRMLALTASVVLSLVALDVYCVRSVILPAYR